MSILQQLASQGSAVDVSSLSLANHESISQLHRAYHQTVTGHNCVIVVDDVDEMRRSLWKLLPSPDRVPDSVRIVVVVSAKRRMHSHLRRFLLS